MKFTSGILKELILHSTYDLRKEQFLAQPATAQSKKQDDQVDDGTDTGNEYAGFDAIPNLNILHCDSTNHTVTMFMSSSCIAAPSEASLAIELTLVEKDLGKDVPETSPQNTAVALARFSGTRVEVA